MAGNPERIGPRAVLGVVIAGAVVAFFWAFPPFHVVSLNALAAARAATGATAFDAAASAAQLWAKDLPAAARRAVELKVFARQLRQDPAGTAKKYAKFPGLGTAYYFVRGSGRVVARERNYVRIALDGADAAVVALRIGPVFGNTVRDGCGLLDVNSFPGLQEFNALAAALNALVEKNVLPALRDQASVGATVSFAGCAEAPETAPGPDEPLLTLIPVEAEVH